MTEYKVESNLLTIKRKNYKPVQIHFINYSDNEVSTLDQLINLYKVEYCKKDDSVTAKLFFRQSNESIIDKVIEAHYKYRFAWLGTLLTAIITNKYEDKSG